ncbi:MAG: hypothetical protein KKG59_01275 [Nanoarchaeota archaeon]|nr:hypothetical protein [Nanoarchaeota archaeon]
MKQTLIGWWIVTLIISLGYVAAADQVELQSSPVDLEDYFNSGGNHYNTKFEGGVLQLEDGFDDGYWLSPIFHVPEDNLKALWNHMEGVANWNDFDLNYANTNPGFEQSAYGWEYWRFPGARDTSRSHTGTASYRLTTGHSTGQGAFYSRVDQGSPRLNMIPITPDDTVHLTYWIDADIEFGRITPTLWHIRELNGDWEGMNELSRILESPMVTYDTPGFQRVQVEYPLYDALEEDGYNYYAYIWIDFQWFKPQVPTGEVWFDDIMLFKDSRIKIQARASQNNDCSNMFDWSLRPERLLYNNYITVPAPVGKCVQFKVNLNRIDSGPASGESPELEELNFTFAKAYDWTRPLEDIEDAEFNYPADLEIGQIRTEDDGELYHDPSGQKIRFHGLQSEQQTVDAMIEEYGYTQGINTYGDYVCEFAEKYGFNLIKTFAHWDAHNEVEIHSGLDKYRSLVEKCKEKNIYLMVYLSAPGYLSTEHNNLWGNGYGGPIEFVHDDVLETYKNYLSIVFSHEFDGLAIKDDPAFVIVSLMNERSLVNSWSDSQMDKIFVPSSTQRKELNPYWVEKFREDVYEDWLTEGLNAKYPTWDDLCAAWGGCGLPNEPPFVEEDGTCTEQTYGTDECQLQILAPSYLYTQGYELRVKDLIQFLVEREEYVYSEVRDHLKNTIGTDIFAVGGKSPWGFYPASEVGLEQLEMKDQHIYMPNGEWTVYDESGHGEPATYHIEDNSVISNFNSELLVWSLLKVRFSDKPYMIGETTFSGFSEHISEQILLSLLGAHAGWDAYTLFHQNWGPDSWDAKMKVYNIFSNAPLIALQPTAGRLFRRDVQKAPTRKSYLTRDSLKNVNVGFPYHMQEDWIDPANTLLYDISWGSLDHYENNLPNLGNPDSPFIPSTQSFVFDLEKRRVKITTPKTQGAVGDYNGESESLDDFGFELTELQGLPTYGVFLTSLDDLDLDESEKMLLTLVSHADNSQHLWDTYHRASWCNDEPWREWLQFGKDPVWMGAVEADITLNIDESIYVYPLDLHGRRTADVFAVDAEGGQVSFHVGKDYTTPWYLIQVQKEGITTEKLLENIIKWFAGEIDMQTLIGMITVWKATTQHID